MNAIDITLAPDIVQYIKECRGKEHSESYLISVMHRVQDRYGFLSNHHMQEIAELLEVPAATVSGVATFYHFFRLKPQGKNMIHICMGTACYVKGAPEVLEAFKDELGIDVGDTTKDGLFSLEMTRCVGVCGLAPVVMINDEVHGKLTAKSVPVIIGKIREAAAAE